MLGKPLGGVLHNFQQLFFGQVLAEDVDELPVDVLLHLVLLVEVDQVVDGAALEVVLPGRARVQVDVVLNVDFVVYVASKAGRLGEVSIRDRADQQVLTCLVDFVLPYYVFI